MIVNVRIVCTTFLQSPHTIDLWLRYCQQSVKSVSRYQLWFLDSLRTRRTHGEVNLSTFVTVRTSTAGFSTFIGGGVIAYSAKHTPSTYFSPWRPTTVFRNTGIPFGEIDVVFKFWTRELGSAKEKYELLLEIMIFCVLMQVVHLNIWKLKN